ncbi:membrane protein insertion efficiency factor YidD [Candidatus Peregrinibacteria bacterium CG11_big_fil_rev_8_21_14_0_20_46_8]|nr:MAG: membrane protein insertion efficiency factor YidD [Candidatus Peregrinibacteria bacterium CG11_big_fil_rev_8_21_14_0_20_46_8]
MKQPFLGLIRLYQKTLSPDHGLLKGIFPAGFCKYSPSCSEYSYQAIEKHGVIMGLLKGLWRILRCNPFSKGGEDRV